MATIPPAQATPMTPKPAPKIATLASGPAPAHTTKYSNSKKYILILLIGILFFISGLGFWVYVQFFMP